jgi:AcrR family transcriptional regulator
MGRTRLAIGDGVAQCLVARGARKTTMIDIAAAAGIAKGTLYNHVRTRTEAYLLCAELEVERVVDLLIDGVDLQRPPGRLLDGAGRVEAARRLGAVADAIATHPVVRALATTEPAALATALTSGSPAEGLREEVRRALVGVVGEQASNLAMRWLLSLLFDAGALSERAETVDLLLAAAAGSTRELEAQGQAVEASPDAQAAAPDVRVGVAYGDRAPAIPRW